MWGSSEDHYNLHVCAAETRLNKPCVNMSGSCPVLSWCQVYPPLGRSRSLANSNRVIPKLMKIKHACTSLLAQQVYPWCPKLPIPLQDKYYHKRMEDNLFLNNCYFLTLSFQSVSFLEWGYLYMQFRNYLEVRLFDSH